MEEEVNLEELKCLYPKLRLYVKVLLTHEFGLLRDLPEIQGLQCGAIITKNTRAYADRFQLRIPYCRKLLNWQVLMNGHDVTKAPDFIMEENFLADATPDTIKTKVPSLANWNPNDVKCLLNVVLELLELYKDYQVNILRMNPNLHRYLFEYETLLSITGLEKSDVEVFVQFRSPVVTFLIHVNVDFSKLPAALPDSRDLMVLVVEFKENAKNTIQLMPRIELEDALGGPLELPDLSPDVSLMDYVPQLEELLRKKVQLAIEQTHRRKMLYSYLVQFFEPALLTGDNITFRNVSFLLELTDFFCVLNVHIPTDYPESRPRLEFLSLNKWTSGRPPEFNNFLYDHKMTHEEVARSIFLFVKDTAIAEYRKTLSSKKPTP